MPRRSANFSRPSVKIGRDPPVEKALENKMLGPQKELSECQNPTSRTSLLLYQSRPFYLEVRVIGRPARAPDAAAELWPFSPIARPGFVAKPDESKRNTHRGEAIIADVSAGPAPVSQQ